jgi:hypothetical protein
MQFLDCWDQVFMFLVMYRYILQTLQVIASIAGDIIRPRTKGPQTKVPGQIVFH